MSSIGKPTADYLIMLRHETEVLLDGFEIYPVLNYAWDDEDTPNPNYVGIAMWTTDAPFELDHNWFASSPPPNPSPRDEIFYTAGEDFFGVMDFARNAIGIALYSSKQPKSPNILEDDEIFWEYAAIASMWLNIAGDRVRTYFIAARFAMTTKEYEKSRGRKDYQRPFLEFDSKETLNAKSSLDKLVITAKALEDRRSVRNKVVHTVTSRQGKHAVEAIRRQREDARKQQDQPVHSLEAVKHADGGQSVLQLMYDERAQNLANELSKLKEWYFHLLDAAASTFEYEYWRRIQR